MLSQTSLNQMTTLLRDFLEGRFSAQEFVDAFFPIARILRDDVLKIVKTDPTFAPVFQALGERKISPQDYEIEWTKFLDSLNQADRILVLADKPLGHLWVEADAYWEDPKDQEPGTYIGEDELKEVVRETLNNLNSLS